MIDPKKQYRTRDGREVRIYAVDGGGDYPVHGAYEFNDRWQVNQWSASGGTNHLTQDDYLDLVEVKPRIQREVWVNVYPDGQIMHEQRKTADAFSVDNTDRRIACVKLVIDCEEGEGL